MESKKQIRTFLMGSFFLGFILHFLWEIAQCSAYFIHPEPQPGIRDMFVATLGDLIMMIIIYVLTSIIFRSQTWSSRAWDLYLILVLTGVSAAVALLVEFWGIESGRWTYTSANPLIAGVGISWLPILQMTLLTPVAFYLAKVFLNRQALRPGQTKEIL